MDVVWSRPEGTGRGRNRLRYCIRGLAPTRWHAECADEFREWIPPSIDNEMTKSYIQVLKQIDTLKAEAERLRRQEVDGVIDRIRDAIRHYGLTAADLGLSRAKSEASGPARKTRGRRKAKAAAASAAAKYRDDQGHSWVGRGKRPQWLRDAIAAGKNLEDFAV